MSSALSRPVTVAASTAASALVRAASGSPRKSSSIARIGRLATRIAASSSASASATQRAKASRAERSRASR